MTVAIVKGVRGSQSTRVVLEITAMRDTMPSDLFEDLLRGAASIRTDRDEAIFLALLADMRTRNLKAPTGKSRRERRADLAKARRS